MNALRGVLEPFSGVSNQFRGILCANSDYKEHFGAISRHFGGDGGPAAIFPQPQSSKPQPRPFRGALYPLHLRDIPRCATSGGVTSGGALRGASRWFRREGGGGESHFDGNCGGR